MLFLPTSLTAQTPIAAPSALEVNLAFVPFDGYNTSTSPSAYGNLQNACPGSTSVRACYQSIFANFHAQNVTGVRFFFGICGGFHSTPLSNCGQNYTKVTGPNSTWTANVASFFSDLYSAGIRNVEPNISHSDLVGITAPQGTQGVQYAAPAAPPVPPVCSGTPSVVEYAPGLPYGTVPCTNTSPYYCPSGQNCAKYCQANAGFPIDDHYHGYNCSPANPYFVGWTNLNNVVNAVLAAAYNTPTSGAKGIIVDEFDVEQELNMVQFPVLARFVVDNAQTQTGNPDAVASIRNYMSLYHYDTGRVAWSATATEPNTANYDCISVYGSNQSARVINLDSIFSAIEGGFIGQPHNDSGSQGLFCGGDDSTMFQMPVPHSAPDIADLHAYPCIKNPSTGYCYSDDPDANVEGEAKIVYGDVLAFLNTVNPSAVFMVGETHSNSNNGQNETCEGHAPLDAASLNVAGYNASLVAGHSVIFRPWINIPDPSDGSTACFDPANQNVNQNNQGPYLPKQ